MISNLSVCAIVPFFSPAQKLGFLRSKEFPKYFGYFLESFRQCNPQIHLKIFSDCSFDAYQSYRSRNVEFHPLRAKEFSQLIAQTTGLKVDRLSSQQLASLRPAFGTIFADYLKGFKFWGYCQIEMIFGDLDYFLSPERLAEADLLMTRLGWAGEMMFYRNSLPINSLYRYNLPGATESAVSAQTASGVAIPVIAAGDEGAEVLDLSTRPSSLELARAIAHQQLKSVVLRDLAHYDAGPQNRGRQWRYCCAGGRLLDLSANEWNACVIDRPIGSVQFVDARHLVDLQIEPLLPGQPIEVDRVGIRSITP